MRGDGVRRSQDADSAPSREGSLAGVGWVFLVFFFFVFGQNFSGIKGITQTGKFGESLIKGLFTNAWAQGIRKSAKGSVVHYIWHE